MMKSSGPVPQSFPSHRQCQLPRGLPRRGFRHQSLGSCQGAPLTLSVTLQAPASSGTQDTEWPSTSLLLSSPSTAVFYFKQVQVLPGEDYSRAPPQAFPEHCYLGSPDTFFVMNNLNLFFDISNLVPLIQFTFGTKFHQVLKPSLSSHDPFRKASN